MIKILFLKYNNFPLLIIAAIVMIFSGFCASLTAALVRLASQDLHPFQIAFFRSFLVIPLLAPLIYKDSFEIIKTSKPTLTFIRSLSGSGAMLFFFLWHKHN